jgi:hypothetical protein
MDLAVASGEGRGFRGGVALVGVLLVEEPDAARLSELDAFLMQPLVHPFRAPAVVLGDHGDRDEILAVQDHVVIAGLRRHLGDLLRLDGDRVLKLLPFLALRFELLQGRDGDVRVCQDVVDGVQAMPADGRQDLRGHPALEAFCRGQLASEDERIQAGLVDDDRILLTPDGVTNRYPIGFVLVIDMVDECFSRIGVAEDRGDVLADEPRLIADRSVRWCVRFRTPRL